MLMCCDLWPKEFKIEQQAGLLLATLRYVENVTCKVITHKPCGEVSLVEQDTIECVSVAFLKSKWFSHLYSMQLFSADATMFLRKIKKTILPMKT